MASKYSDETRAAVLASAAAHEATGMTTTSAMKAAGKEHSVPLGTIKMWRVQTGLAQPVGTQKESAAAAALSWTERVDSAIALLLEVGTETLTHARAEQDRDGLRVGNTLLGTGIDKALKRGLVSQATSKTQVEVSTLAAMTDEQLTALASGE